MVPGGGLSPDYDRWIGCKPGFFLPVRVLSRLFRRLFLEALEDAFYRGKLCFFGETESLRDAIAFAACLVSRLDTGKYPKGIKVGKPEFAAIQLRPDTSTANGATP